MTNTRTDTIRRAATATILVIAPVAALLARLSWGAELPDPLPTHWDIHGEVNGTTGATAFFVGCLAVSAVLSVLGITATINKTAESSFLAGGAACGSWVVTAIYVQTVFVSKGASQADEVLNPWWVVLVVLAVGIIAFVAVKVLLPGDHHGEASASKPSDLKLGPTERVVWVGSSMSTILRAVVVVLALGAAVATTFSWVLGLSLLVGAAACACTYVVTVRIDDRGLHTLWGPLGWPRTTIPLSEIISASADQIEPAQWGGWGYRISPRGRAVIVRRGPGLVLHRTGRPTYAVTVDHADTAADVLNALLQRAHREA